jgi:hypothetical protein
MSADNQQGRLSETLSYYIAGFVDGEGSFHVAVQKSQNVKLGWQIIPEFHVSQNSDRTTTLKTIQKVLGCGYVKPNHLRRVNDKTNVFVVRNHQDLIGKVVPFFEKYKLISSKNGDFKKFASIVRLINKKKHLEIKGLKRILKIAFTMNSHGKYRKLSLETILASLEPSETTC